MQPIVDRGDPADDATRRATREQQLDVGVSEEWILLRVQPLVFADPQRRHPVRVGRVALVHVIDEPADLARDPGLDERQSTRPIDPLAVNEWAYRSSACRSRDRVAYFVPRSSRGWRPLPSPRAALLIARSAVLPSRRCRRVARPAPPAVRGLDAARSSSSPAIFVERISVRARRRIVVRGLADATGIAACSAIPRRVSRAGRARSSACLELDLHWAASCSIPAGAGRSRSRGQRAALADRYWTMVIGAEFGRSRRSAFIQTRPPWVLERKPVLDRSLDPPAGVADGAAPDDSREHVPERSRGRLAGRGARRHRRGAVGRRGAAGPRRRHLRRLRGRALSLRRRRRGRRLRSRSSGWLVN